MPHPVLYQYKLLIRSVVRQFSDSFSMYETWGSFDINCFLWSELTAVEKLQITVAEQFPRSEPQFAVASRIHHFHLTEAVAPPAYSPVHALAVQEGVELPGLRHDTYLAGKYPGDMPERSVRAFTYVEAAGEDLNREYTRRGIAGHIRQRLGERFRKFAGDYRRMTTIELTPGIGSKQFESTVVVVDFVATEYRHLASVPTSIIESLGESAVRTITCLETRRIMLQSDRMLF
jgi:hypothetical protein